MIYLQADLPELIKRFSDTRRKHPLSTKGLPLSEAIEVERNLLSDVASESDLFIDTTYTNIHQLRAFVKERIIKHDETGHISFISIVWFQTWHTTRLGFCIRCTLLA